MNSRLHRMPRHSIPTIYFLYRTSNMCLKICTFLKCAICTVLVVAYMTTRIILLVLKILGIPVLRPGMCEVQKVLPKHRYEFTVTPNDPKTKPFTILRKMDRPGFKDYKKWQKNRCFWNLSCDEDGCEHFMQLHSKKRDRSIVSIVVCWIWIAINLILGVLYPMCTFTYLLITSKKWFDC